MFKLPELNYSYDALEPYIDRNTMEIHHSKHHAGYVKKFNIALKNFDIGKNTTIESIIRSLNDDVPTDLYWDIKNNGGGVLNHNLFFQIFLSEEIYLF
jgi:Fe-Mn family superoxide dismutase